MEICSNHREAVNRDFRELDRLPPGFRRECLYDVSMYIGQPSSNAIVIERQLFVIESQQMQRCRMQVIDSDWVFRRLAAKVIGSAIRKPRLQTGSGKPASEAVRMMIATGGRACTLRQPASVQTR